jgi:hypothetical protein
LGKGVSKWWPINIVRQSLINSISMCWGEPMSELLDLALELLIELISFMDLVHQLQVLMD